MEQVLRPRAAMPPEEIPEGKKGLLWGQFAPWPYLFSSHGFLRTMYAIFFSCARADDVVLPEDADPVLAHYVGRLRELGRDLETRLEECLRPEVRQKRWRGVLRRQWAEQRMLKILCEDTPPDKVIIGWGEASCRGAMRFRELAVRHGINVVPIDEANTSKRCSACLQELKGFRQRGRFRTYDRRWCRIRACPRVARDRDVNASINILRLLIDELTGTPCHSTFKKRPLGGRYGACEYACGTSRG